ncbi:MAG: T9SS type A sorting domain-containing protein, partial [Paludibacter sp.]
GIFSGYANSFSPLSRNNMMIFESPILVDKKHTVRVICDGSKTVTSNDIYINIDAIGAYSANAQLSLPLDGEPLPTLPKPPLVDNSNGTNILLNPSFESGDDGIWNETITGGPVTGITGTFPARWDLSSAQSGSFALVHATTKANLFNVSTSQTIQNPQEGLYRLRFWARSSGGLITSEVRFKSSAGTFTLKIPQTLNSAWTKFTLDSILIKGACTVEIADFTNLGRWVAIDNMELFRFAAIPTAIHAVYSNLYENQVKIFLNNRIATAICEKTIDRLQVFDLSGKLIFNKLVADKTTNINTEKWSSAIYLFSITVENETITKKISL